jgi:hypothetical protein
MLTRGFNSARLYLESEEWIDFRDGLGYALGQAIGFTALSVVSVLLFLLKSAYDNLAGYLETQETITGPTVAEMAAIYGLTAKPEDDDGNLVLK